MDGAISNTDLRRLSSGRWLMPILAQMSREDGSRFSVLLRTLAVSRSVLSRHLAVLETFGWIERNPGHGHPLRPEYRLSPSGVAVAAWCDGVMRQRERLGLEHGALGRWTLPLVRELQPGSRRFADLERALAPVTPRALSLTLQQAQGAELTRRAGEPRMYALTRRGAALAAAVNPAGCLRTG